MANDPNRDLLPVKDSDDKSNRGGNCRADHNIITKLKRCDLEDKYMRLYDENTEIKKQLNCQEDKIKRLGTKLRLIDEKKNFTDNYGRKLDSKGLDELRMRIIELEHENYTLKDKNVVLKQQLSNHARQHVAAHRSPNRSLHTSPRISHRQTSAPNVNENRADIQLREAEEHISGLNDEIKNLHDKIDRLQQDLERSSLENQKTKVSENIELIRLQRSLKQQSIQIASLQAQIKSSEKSQKLLREELATSHKENEESLQIIADKQKEILDLYRKLEEKNVSCLEQEEMKERINDLTLERDSLKERGEFLMKSLETKSSETDIISDLRKLLAVEKSKKDELKMSLEHSQKVLQSLKNSARNCQLSESEDSLSMSSGQNESKTDCRVQAVKVQSTIGTQTSITLPQEINKAESDLKLLASTQLVISTLNERTPSGSLAMKSKDIADLQKMYSTRSIGTSTNLTFNCICSESVLVTEENAPNLKRNPFFHHEAERENMIGTEKVYCAEKINLERELEYVKQMLRSQTQRCDAQESEINRLSGQLRASEEKYQDAVKRMDIHLKILRHLESRASLDVHDEHESHANEHSKEEELLEKNDETDTCKNNKFSNFARKNTSLPADKKKFSGRYLGSSDDNHDENSRGENSPTPVKIDNDRVSKSRKISSLSRKKGSVDNAKKNGRVNKESSVSHDKLHHDSNHPGSLNADKNRPIPLPRKVIPAQNSSPVYAGKKLQLHSCELKKTGTTTEHINLCIEWLKLEPNTSIWDNNNIKLLFVDFSFLDMNGEETETPNSLRKPKKPVEKCQYNFIKNIVINDYRKSVLNSMRNKPDSDLIVFKVVSEPEEFMEDSECLDIGVASVTVKQFFESKWNMPILLRVKSINDVEEIIGTLSVKLDVSAIG